MNKFFSVIIIGAFSLSVKAQTKPAATPTAEPYGKIDMADLEMKVCDFEKDANAEVLFDKAIVSNITWISMERHTRIKIFNDFGKKEANIRLYGADITSISAETINLNNGKVEITPLDKTLIYEEKTNQQISAVVFTLPNVKAGSVIEFKYKGDFRLTWYFQSSLPTRYSEIQTELRSTGIVDIKAIAHVKQPFVKDIGTGDDFKQLKALANIHSLSDEPYMGSRQGNLQRMEYLGNLTYFDSWDKIGKILVNDYKLGGQFSRGIAGESIIIKQAKELKSDDEKISFIFDQVKDNMKWDEISSSYTTEGTVRAWDRKIGNSAEINLIVYRLLKKTGIKAYPMVVSTKNNGKLNPFNPGIFNLNNVIVYIPVDSTKCYVLDATAKYNLFNTIPIDNLNTYGLILDESNPEYKTIFLENTNPSMQSVFLNAEIKPDGKMTGTLERTSYSYNKTSALQKYKTDGEEKYIKFLCDSDNNIKMAAVKLNDMEVDSLPLSLKADFTIDLGGAENYIYFKTNLFMTMGANPFLSESRFSDIDFGYLDNYSVSGIYKLPEGYKTEALPKSITIVMPDQSIVFKRIVAEDNGTVVVRYALNHKKTIYFSDNYQDLRGFYKKMYEMLNEQIVLKRS